LPPSGRSSESCRALFVTDPVHLNVSPERPQDFTTNRSSFSSTERAADCGSVGGWGVGCEPPIPLASKSSIGLVFGISAVDAPTILAVLVSRTFAVNLTLSPSGITVPVTSVSTPAICPSFLAVWGSIKPVVASLCS